MSGGAVFQEALRVLVRQTLPDRAERDLLAALLAGRPGPLEFLYEAGFEAGVSQELIIPRAVAVFFNYCAGNLSDDLSDAECTYLDEPYRMGPCTQLSLQNLFFHVLTGMDFPHETMSSLACELIAAVGQQHIELTTTHWTAPTYRAVAEGIAGRQWSVYLQILWHGTEWAADASKIGMTIGVAVHTARDIESSDRRYETLSPGEKVDVVGWALRSSKTLHSYSLRCVDALLRGVERTLQEATDQLNLPE